MIAGRLLLTAALVVAPSVAPTKVDDLNLPCIKAQSRFAAGEHCVNFAGLYGDTVMFENGAGGFDWHHPACIDQQVNGFHSVAPGTT